MTIEERVLNDEMYAWKADARRYLDGESMVTGDWSLTFAARVVWLVDEMARLVAENERLRETLDICAAEKAVLRANRDRLREGNSVVEYDEMWAKMNEANAQAEALGEARDRLREELETLRFTDATTKDRLQGQLHILRRDKEGQLQAKEEALISLREENERLWNALQYIAENASGGDVPDWPEFARAALADQPTEEKA